MATEKHNKFRRVMTIILCTATATVVAAMTLLRTSVVEELACSDPDRVMAALTAIDHDELRSDKYGDLRVKALATLREAPLDDILARMHDDRLTDEQRRRLAENLGALKRADLERKIDAYFAATAEARDEILDRHLAEWNAPKQWGKRARKQRSTDHQAKSSAAKRHHDAPTIAERKQKMEGTNPDQAARQWRYFAALKERARRRDAGAAGRK